jgi:hypothetical protein
MLKCGLIWLSPAFVSAARYCNRSVVGPVVGVKVGVFVTPVGVRVGVLVTPVGVFVGVLVIVAVVVGVLVIPPPEYQTRTGIQSRKKSREVLLPTLTIRTRRLALVNSLVFHARPQVSLALPKMSLRSVVARFVPVFIVVQLVPLFHESCRQKRRVPEALSTRASVRTSMPVMLEPAGIESG